MNIQTAQGAIDVQISIQEFTHTLVSICECSTMFNFCQTHLLSLDLVNIISTVASLKAKTENISHVIN